MGIFPSSTQFLSNDHDPEGITKGILLNLEIIIIIIDCLWTWSHVASKDHLHEFDSLYKLKICFPSSQPSALNVDGEYFIQNLSFLLQILSSQLEAGTKFEDMLEYSMSWYVE